MTYQQELIISFRLGPVAEYSLVYPKTMLGRWGTTGDVNSLHLVLRLIKAMKLLSGYSFFSFCCISEIPGDHFQLEFRQFFRLGGQSDVILQFVKGAVMSAVLMQMLMLRPCIKRRIKNTYCHNGMHDLPVIVGLVREWVKCVTRTRVRVAR